MHRSDLVVGVCAVSLRGFVTYMGGSGLVLRRQCGAVFAVAGGQLLCCWPAFSAQSPPVAHGSLAAAGLQCNIAAHQWSCRRFHPLAPKTRGKYITHAEAGFTTAKEKAMCQDPAATMHAHVTESPSQAHTNLAAEQPPVPQRNNMHVGRGDTCSLTENHTQLQGRVTRPCHYTRQ
jgi:hypothetical protein